MAEKILMVALSPTMEQGVIASWKVKQGDSIKEGQVLCEVETDKASVEYESTQSGTILKITKEQGSQASVGEMIAIVGKQGEDISALLVDGGNSSSPSQTQSSSAQPLGNFEYDVVVIGTGPGGYITAIRASQLGLKTAVVEKEDVLGGVCLNWGCIPSKSLIHQAELFHEVGENSYLGYKFDKSSFSYTKVQEKSRAVASQLNKGVAGLMKKNKITVIKGYGKIKSPKSVDVDGKEITTKNIIIATGSSPRVIPGFEFDEQQVLSSNGFLSMKELPKSMIIMGGGVIGCEFAYVLNSFGCEVTIIEAMDRILAIEDAEAVSVFEKYFKKNGIKIIASTKAKSLKKSASGVEVEIEGKDGVQTIKAEKILVSIGRSPNTSNIGLENVGIQTDRGFVQVGDYYQTSVPSIFAIGDIIPTPQLAHVASKEGEIAVEYIAGHHTIKRIPEDEIPAAIYALPTIGSFGPNEAKLKEKGVEFGKYVFPFIGIGKAIAVDKSEGFIKVCFDKKTKEILSAVIVGPQAPELIHEILLAKKSELLPEDIATMIHAHPALSEGVMEVMRGIEGWAIHI